MSPETNPQIDSEFCQQVRRDGGYMALSHLDNLLKDSTCPDCPNSGTDKCKKHIKTLIHNILPSIHK